MAGNEQFSNDFSKFMMSAINGSTNRSTNGSSSTESPSTPVDLTPHPDPKLKKKYLDELENQNKFWGKNVHMKYKFLTKIGHGTYGEVYKGQDKTNPQCLVALKKIITDRDTQGFPITALRESRILQTLKHEHVVKLIEVCHNKACEENKYRSEFFFVFEFCEHDLAGLLRNPNVKFSLSEIKELTRQMLSGLFFIHTNKILHRDLKTSNILVTKKGILKLADFGLSRAFSEPTEEKPNSYTNCVVTLWYRPPELLFGERNYGPAIDMWGAGCIMAEFWTHSPIMQGSSELDQLKCISFLRGKITPEVWPNVEKYDVYRNMRLPENPQPGIMWKRLMSRISDKQGCNLLEKLLFLDPEKRCDANNALDHDFFWTDPMPTSLTETMSKLKISNFEYTTQRANKKRPPVKKTEANNDGASTSGFPDRIF